MTTQPGGENSHSNGLFSGNQDTLEKFSNPLKRSPRITQPLPENVLDFVPDQGVRLDTHKFIAHLRSARRGSALGPSGMRSEHLKLLIEDHDSIDDFCVSAGTYCRCYFVAPHERIIER